MGIFGLIEYMTELRINFTVFDCDDYVSCVWIHDAEQFLFVMFEIEQRWDKVKYHKGFHVMEDGSCYKYLECVK